MAFDLRPGVYYVSVKGSCVAAIQDGPVLGPSVPGAPRFRIVLRFAATVEFLGNGSFALDRPEAVTRTQRLDQTPVAVGIDIETPETLQQTIRRMLAAELAQYQTQEEHPEVDDFDLDGIDDADISDFKSVHEIADEVISRYRPKPPPDQAPDEAAGSSGPAERPLDADEASE